MKFPTVNKTSSNDIESTPKSQHSLSYKYAERKHCLEHSK